MSVVTEETMNFLKNTLAPEPNPGARIRSRERRLGSERVLTANEPDENHDDRDDEEKVDKPSHRIRRHESEEPQYEKYRRNGEQHRVVMMLII